MFPRTFFVISSLAFAIRALDTTTLPLCGQTCVANGLSTETACSKTDVLCLCNNYSFGYNLGACLAVDCMSMDLTTSVNWLAASCREAVGTSYTPPTSGSSGSSGSSGTSGSSGSTGSSSSSSSFHYKPVKKSRAGAIGAGLGIPGGVIAVATAIFLWYRKRKAHNNDAVTKAGTANDAEAQNQNTTAADAPPPAISPMPEKQQMAPVVQEIYPPQQGQQQWPQQQWSQQQGPQQQWSQQQWPQQQWPQQQWPQQQWPQQQQQQQQQQPILQQMPMAQPVQGMQSTEHVQPEQMMHQPYGTHTPAQYPQQHQISVDSSPTPGYVAPAPVSAISPAASPIQVPVHQQQNLTELPAESKN